MPKKFNDTGLCIPEKHYMADISAKLEAILGFIEAGDYFTINRPRQYGKTTIAYLLSKYLATDPDYLLLEMSFEGIGDSLFQDEASFCTGFAQLLCEEIQLHSIPHLDQKQLSDASQIINFAALSEFITRLVTQADTKIVLSIDEIDKNSNNQVFLSFLGVLREKYLQRNRRKDHTFQSVILVGVHDIKTLKRRFSPESQGTYNSPWNIAIDFTVDMSFQPWEIEKMLVDYAEERGVDMDTVAISERIYYYSSGYPYLVSKLCKVSDEVLRPKGSQENWETDLIDQAFKYLVDESYTTTLFDDIFKNLKNNPELYELIFEISYNGLRVKFNILDDAINLGSLYGILDKDEEGICKIHNRIFEQKIYGVMLSKEIREKRHHRSMITSRFYEGDSLNLQEVLLGFQTFMRENYSHKDIAFLEREGRLLFLSFLKPIINGKGFDFKEPNVAAERRMDLVITFADERYVVEMKRWEGEAYHQRGLQQLSDYLDTYALREGFLLIFDFRKQKEYKQELILFGDKEIFAVWV